MALPTVVSDFIEAVQDSLTTGSDLGQDLRGAAQNYLRAQDFASILELLQDEMTTSTELTATGGTATTVVDGAATFVPGQQVGNYVQFEADTTTADLQGQRYRILGNTSTTLTVERMAGTAVSGDTYQIIGGWFADHIEDLREGHDLGDAPRGSLLGEARVMLDALAVGLRRFGTYASGTLTLTGNALNTETVTIGARVYTFQTVLTDVDGNVLIGASASASLDNLIAAITLGAGAGTTYAASMTEHALVTAAAAAGDAMLVTAKLPGDAGNLDSTETLTNGSWGAATLTGGADAGAGTIPERTISRPGLVTAAGSTTTEVKLEMAGLTPRIDQFKGLKATIDGVVRSVVKSDEFGTLTVAPALASAPAAAVAVTLVVDELKSGSRDSMSGVVTHAGRQPGENSQLAHMIGALADLLDGYTLPA